MVNDDSHCLPSPIRGTPGWWQELGGEEVSRSEPLPAVPPRKGTRKSATPIRADLVARIRQEIAAGTYDTDEKWQAALDRLLERL